MSQVSQCPMSLPSVFQKALPQASATLPCTFVNEERAGTDVGMGPSQPSVTPARPRGPARPARLRCQSAGVWQAAETEASALQDSGLGTGRAGCGWAGMAERGYRERKELS